MSWYVVYFDQVWRYIACSSKEEAETLTAETLRLHPDSKARADWYYPTVNGD